MEDTSKSRVTKKVTTPKKRETTEESVLRETFENVGAEALENSVDGEAEESWISQEGFVKSLIF